MKIPNQKFRLKTNFFKLKKDHVSQEQQRNKLKNVSMNELVSRNSQSALGGIGRI